MSIWILGNYTFQEVYPRERQVDHSRDTPRNLHNCRSSNRNIYLIHLPLQYCWSIQGYSKPRILHKGLAVAQPSMSMIAENRIWVPDFNREWKRLKSTSLKVDFQKLLIFHSNSINWTSVCDSFLLSHFLLYEQIISCFKSISKMRKIYFESLSPKTISVLEGRATGSPSRILVKNKWLAFVFQRNIRLLSVA